MRYKSRELIHIMPESELAQARRLRAQWYEIDDFEPWFIYNFDLHPYYPAYL